MKFFFFLLLSTTLAHAASCEEPSFAQKILKKITCPKRIRESINYKDKKGLKGLCYTYNDFTPDCLIFGKDAGIPNDVLVKVCPNADPTSPQCLLRSVDEESDPMTCEIKKTPTP